MLDLGLEHLGVDVGAAGAGVEAVLKACGDSAHLELWVAILAYQHLPVQYFLVLRTRKPDAQRTKLLYWSRHIRPLLVSAYSLVPVPSPLTLLLDGLSRLPPIRLKSEAELENQKNPEASHLINDRHTEPDDESAPPVDARPPPIIVSPDSETRIFAESPVAAEGPASTVSNASSTFSHANQPGYPPLCDPPPIQAPAPPDAAAIRSRPSSPTPVSGDIILPLMIFAVVKANPSHFVSHLLYTQRFRNQRVGGEESYCLVNLMAVADFLENVDLKALGLGESEKKVMRFV